VKKATSLSSLGRSAGFNAMTSEGPMTDERFLRHASWVRGLARHLVRDAYIADDLAQETMTAAFLHAPEQEEELRPWLKTVLLNFVRKHFRTAARRERREKTVADDRQVPDGETVLGAIQLQQLVTSVFEELAEPLRTTLMQRFYYGLSAAEIARQAGIPQSTVRSRVALGLEAMRCELDRRYGDRGEWKRLLAPIAAAPAVPLSVGPALPLPAGVVAAALLAIVAVVGVRAARRSVSGVARSGESAAQQARSRGGEDPTAPSGLASLAAATGSGAEAGTSPLPRASTVAPEGLGAGATGSGPVLPEARVEGRTCVIGNRRLPLPPSVDHGRPRLLVDAARICAIRAAIETEGTTGREIHGLIAARLGQDRPDLWTSEQLNYARAFQAEAAAFVFLLTGEARYATQAFAALDAIARDPGSESTWAEGYGLARAKTGRALALVYDWAYHGLDDRQRAFLKEQLQAAADAWPAYRRRGSLDAPEASYWVPTCRGVELLQILALGEESARAARVVELKASLKRHLESAYGTSGYGQEGLTNIAHGGLFLLPALAALRSIGDRDLDADLARRGLWKAAVYATDGAATGESGGATGMLQVGVAAPLANDAGWASLLWSSVPPAARGVYKRFFDQHYGRTSGRPLSRRYEFRESGLVWALLNYPDDVAPAPSAALPAMLADDEQGAYFFRRTVGGAGGDIAVAFMGDFRTSPFAWDIAEGFNLGIRAFGLVLLGGPERGQDVADRTTLLVDGQAPKDAAQRSLVGKPILSEPSGRGGYVAVDGLDLYRAYGLQQAERHLMVDIADDGRSAILSTVDRVRAPAHHLLAWQANIGPHDGDRGLRVETGQEMGVPTFIVRGEGGAHVKGWVLEPRGATVKPGDPLRVETRAASADLWVVMSVAQGEPIAARVEEQGPTGAPSKIRLGTAVLSRPGATGRVELRR
jgi:RNA polymerase sigma-70 factor (ECF subfamily)